MTGDESEGPVTQTPLKAEFGCGTNADESAASVAGLSFPFSDDAVRSGSRARAVTSAISYVRPDDRSRSCSSWWPRTTVMGSNPLKISVDVGHKIQASKSDLMARSVAIDLL